MQFTYTAIFTLFASVAYSQSIASEVAQLPSCALSCLATAATSAGCGLTDYACQCGDAKAAITKSGTPCIVAACSASDVLTVSKVAAQICELQASAGSSGSSPSSTTPASSAASNIGSATGSSIASVTSSASSVASSLKSSATSAAAATASTAAGNRVAAAGAAVGAGFLAAFAL
ncbi:hypothetical protein MFRU_004g02840 [Monilinia fructicola]|nr:hypothetical protein MFRU_004g02840 [Monilinia fructicola]